MRKSKYNSKYDAERFFRNNCEELVRKIEDFVIVSKLSGIQSRIYFNASNKSKLNNVLKLHLELDYKKKFTICYDLSNKKFHFNNTLNKMGRLNCHAPRKEINNFNNIYKTLDDLMEKGDNLYVLE